MNVVALLPSYVNDNFPKLTSFDVGLLMSIYPFAYLATAPLIGGNIKNHGRKNTVLFGVIVMTFSTLMFGMGGFCNDALTFFIVSFIARTFQGMGDGIIAVVIPSIIASEFPKQRELYLGYVNMSLGAGLCLGPMFGALVFRFLSYVDTFLFFSAYILIVGLISVTVLPDRVNIK